MPTGIVQASPLPNYGCVTEAEANAASGPAKEAFLAIRSGNKIEAAPLLEAAAKADPENIIVQRCLAQTLVSLAVSAPDEASANAYWQRAHTAFLKARDLGDEGETVRQGIEITKEKIEFKASALEDALRAGEAAFASGDFRGAVTHYQRALEIDPKSYAAAVFIGDSYFSLKEWNNAGIWFGKAIAIAPNQEVAYRYWGDALLGAGDVTGARDKFIDAIIAEPYSRSAYKGITQWAAGLKRTLRVPRIQIPVSIKGNNISADPKTPPYWLVYGLKQTKAGKDEDAFQTELKALRATIQVAKELGISDPGAQDPNLATLIHLEQKGLLEAHVLMHRATQAVANLYPTYRNTYREQMRRYWIEEVIQP